jgi:hypothetical protein
MRCFPICGLCSSRRSPHESHWLSARHRFPDQVPGRCGRSCCEPTAPSEVSGHPNQSQCRATPQRILRSESRHKGLGGCLSSASALHRQRSHGGLDWRGALSNGDISCLPRGRCSANSSLAHRHSLGRGRETTLSEENKVIFVKKIKQRLRKE